MPSVAQHNVNILHVSTFFKNKYEMVKTANCVCNFILRQCDNAEGRLSKEVNYYQPKETFDPQKIDQYFETLKKHLQTKLREEEDDLKKEWTGLATRTVRSLCGMATTFTAVLLTDLSKHLTTLCIFSVSNFTTVDLQQLEEYNRMLAEDNARLFLIHPPP